MYYSLQQTKVTISLSDVNTTKQDSRYQIKKKLIHYIISEANKRILEIFIYSGSNLSQKQKKIIHFVIRQVILAIIFNSGALFAL